MRNQPSPPKPNHRCLATVATIAFVLKCTSIVVAGTAAAEDQSTAHEYQAAHPQIESMQKVLLQELDRIFFEDQRPQSPEVAKFMNPITVVNDMGDSRLPLHLRVVEQWRRDYFLSGIQVVQDAASGHCEDLLPRPDQLLDPAPRGKGFQNIQVRTRQNEAVSGRHAQTWAAARGELVGLKASQSRAG